MNIQTEIDETVWQPVVDASNAEAKRTHDSLEQSKPDEEKTEFIPVTLEDYVKARFQDIENSYIEHKREEGLAIIGKESAISIARMAKVAQASPEIKDALAAQVDAL